MRSTLIRFLTRWGTGIRYLLTGTSLFVVDFCTFLVLVKLGGLPPAVAQLCARATGALTGFFAHRHFTFRDSLRDPRYGVVRQGSGYLIVAVTTFVVSPFLLVFILALTQGRLVIAKLLTELVLVTTTFVCLRYLFREKGNPS